MGSLVGKIFNETFAEEQHRKDWLYAEKQNTLPRTFFFNSVRRNYYGNYRILEVRHVWCFGTGEYHGNVAAIFSRGKVLAL